MAASINIKQGPGARFAHVMVPSSVLYIKYLHALAGDGKLQVPSSATFSLADVKKAFEQIETKHTTSKVVIVP